MSKFKRNEQFYGYALTHRQYLELKEKLREDILLRYDNEEYWDEDVIDEYAQDNRIVKPQEKE